MRDPKRIDPILDAIRELWIQTPDLRLLQLLVNVIPRKNPCPEVFYFEDDRLLACLRENLESRVSQPVYVEARESHGP